MATLSRHNIQTLLLIFHLSWTLVSSIIYKSLMWTPTNPLFQNHNKTDSKLNSFCYRGELLMNVHLKSVLPVICPFEDLIMQAMESQPSTSSLNENLWIVYDYNSYNSCIINTTALFGGGRQKMKNKLLHKCDTPDTMVRYYYRIDFKEDSPVSGSMYFEAGKDYYFLATSDGRKDSLDKVSGGHCNNDGDNKIRMKFKVHVCGENDSSCSDPNTIGKFQCIRPESPTLSPTTTTTSSKISPSPVISTSTSSNNSESADFVCPTTSILKWVTSTVVINGSVTQSTSNQRNMSTLTLTPSSTINTNILTSSQTYPENGSDNGAVSGKRTGNDEMQASRDKWMVAAFIFLLLFIVVLIIMAIVCYRLKKKYSVPCIYSSQVHDVNAELKKVNTTDKSSLIIMNSSYDNLAQDFEDGGKKKDDTTKGQNLEMQKDKNIHTNGKVTSHDKQGEGDTDSGIGTITKPPVQEIDDKLNTKTKLPPINPKSEHLV